MSKSNIWSDIARYCSELAPVVGPLLSATAEMAQAVDRAALPSASDAPSLKNSQTD